MSRGDFVATVSWSVGYVFLVANKNTRTSKVIQFKLCTRRFNFQVHFGGNCLIKLTCLQGDKGASRIYSATPTIP